MRVASRNVVLSIALIACLAFAGNTPSVLRAETPKRFSCPDSTALKLRSDLGSRAFDPRVHRPLAGAATSGDLATHARLSAMSYAMYDAFIVGDNPLSKLAPNLRAMALIYGDPGPDERLRRPNARDTRTFYGVVADDLTSGRRLIVLRGTLQPNEWVRNLQAGLRPFIRSQFRRRLPQVVGQERADALVHAGFMSIFGSLQLTMVADGSSRPFADALPEFAAGRQLTFIGHSLGGALATLSGVEAARRSPPDAPNMRIITFGSPRVGNRGFAALAQAVGRIDRVCNLVDPVPAVPPSTRLASYVHVGKVFRVSSFDWPDLENGLEKLGQQVSCWHSIKAYAFMTDPAKSTKDIGTCRRASAPGTQSIGPRRGP